jgi:uncharacterized protein
MEYLAIFGATLLMSALALLSGFGLGTVLVPIFAIFFPLPLAIAATAVIHLVSSIFRTFFVGKSAHWNTVWKFGLPAIFAAVLGAYMLKLVANLKPIFSYEFLGFSIHITYIGLIIGIIILAASLFEMLPKLSDFSLPRKYIFLGGFLSGLFGGLSGYQGTLRTIFLIRSGLDKQQFIGTSAICSILVDLSRILIYGFTIFSKNLTELRSISALLTAACAAAFLGSYIGFKFMHIISFKNLKILVGLMLLSLGLAIMLGFETRSAIPNH